MGKILKLGIIENNRRFFMRKLPLIFLFAFMFLTISLFYTIPENSNREAKAMDLEVRSSAFKYGGYIPSRYTCDGENISPQLSWSKGPSGTKSYAIIADDPDAPMGTWVHWVIYNIPDNVTSLPEALSNAKRLDFGAYQGKNDFKKIGYGGPCPPGGTHRYYFKVYALDTVLDSGPGLTKRQLLKAMEGHILAKGELMGKYSR